MSVDTRLANFKAEINGNISVLVRHGIDLDDIIGNAAMPAEHLRQAIEGAKKGGTVIENWAKATGRTLPIGQGKGSFGIG